MNHDENKVDVVVIGAGPSGSTVARLTSKSGLNTILLEAGDVGREKACGGFVPSSILRDFEIPDKVIDRQIFKLKAYYGTSVGEIKIDKSGSVLRGVFDKHMLDEAASEGAKVMPMHQAIDLIVENGKINGVTVKDLKKGNIFNVYSKVVVSAEGARAKIVKKAGLLEEWKHKSITRQYIMKLPSQNVFNERFEDDAIETYWDIEGRGYAWIFPKKDYLYVGIGVETPPLVNIKNLLDDFIKTHPVASSKLSGCKVVGINGGVVVTSGPYSPTYTDNFIAVGEAAGWVGPFYGGGIDYGMYSAKAAAEIIKDAICSGDTSSKMLSSYEKKCWDVNGSYFKRELALKKLALRNHRGKKALIKNFNTDISKTVVKRAMSRSGKITGFMKIKLISSFLLKYATTEV